jgi:hypothetical protein
MSYYINSSKTDYNQFKHNFVFIRYIFLYFIYIYIYINIFN